MRYPTSRSHHGQAPHGRDIAGVQGDAQAVSFDGDEHGLSAVVDRFWQAVETALEPLGIPAKGSFSEVKARRLIRFFDTDLNAINADSYIVRARDVATGEREVTLSSVTPIDTWRPIR